MQAARNRLYEAAKGAAFSSRAGLLDRHFVLRSSGFSAEVMRALRETLWSSAHLR